MLQSNQAVSLPNGGPNPIPDTLQRVIDEYFHCLGDSKQVEKSLFEMLRLTLTNAESTEPSENADHFILFAYTRELVNLLESFTSKRRAELWNN